MQVPSAMGAAGRGRGRGRPESVSGISGPFALGPAMASSRSTRGIIYGVDNNSRYERSRIIAYG